jgi:hypothetical protein
VLLLATALLVPAPVPAANRGVPVSEPALQERDDILYFLDFDDRAVALRRLVECLDDLSPSRSRLEGRNVVLGVVRHEALSQLAYHEETMTTGDIALRWAGHVLPTATARDLRAARRAWELALREEDYSFL